MASKHVPLRSRQAGKRQVYIQLRCDMIHVGWTASSLNSHRNPFFPVRDNGAPEIRGPILETP